MTIICGIVLMYLVISETIAFIAPKTVDVLTVDTRRGEHLPIHMDIFFPRMSCMDVSVDVVEATSGETLEEAAFQIIKHRHDAAGKRMAEGIKVGLKETKRCQPCVPTSLEAIPMAIMRFFRKTTVDHSQSCCHTCEDVRKYLLEHNLPQGLGDTTTQCQVAIPYSDNEGCSVTGFLRVPRGKGDFHIAAGSGYSQRHDEHQHHIHQIDWTRIDKFNISHTIRSLSFGPKIPGGSNPLDNHQIVTSSLAQHIYIIQVIPTSYNSGSMVLNTNQYSFTQHHQRVQQGPSFALPGVYFRYDINPLMIHIHEESYGFANFLTRLCAIIGGLYVVFGIVYSLTGKVVKPTKKQKI